MLRYVAAAWPSPLTAGALAARLRKEAVARAAVQAGPYPGIVDDPPRAV